MTVHTGVRGNTGVVAKFAIPPAAAIDYGGDVRKIEMSSDDKDDSDLTFEEASSGDTKDYTAKVTALFSTEVGSFWRLLWDNPGTEFTVTWGPHGNAVPSADEPHFTMTLKADGKPPFSQEARRGKQRETFDYELEVTAGPVLDDGA
jgi:hypothetical protein